MTRRITLSAVRESYYIDLELFMSSLLWFVTPLLESGENKQMQFYKKDILQELIEINCFNLHFMTLIRHFLGLH